MNDAWFYQFGQQTFGPMPLAELHRLVSIGQIPPDMMVYSSQNPNWTPVGQVLRLPGYAQPDDGLSFIVPTAQTSGKALMAGYFGIFGLFICPLGPVALLFGFLALADLKANPMKNGKGRAWTGIICGAISTLGMLFWLIAVILSPKH